VQYALGTWRQAARTADEVLWVDLLSRATIEQGGCYA
jgi:hypothetical protein